MLIKVAVLEKKKLKLIELLIVLFGKFQVLFYQFTTSYQKYLLSQRKNPQTQMYWLVISSNAAIVGNVLSFCEVFHGYFCSIITIAPFVTR